MDGKEKPQARWDKLNTVYVGVKLMKTTEADLIAKLESVPNKARYIKDLIRADIERGQ